MSPVVRECRLHASREKLKFGLVGKFSPSLHRLQGPAQGGLGQEELLSAGQRVVWRESGVWN